MDKPFDSRWVEELERLRMEKEEAPASPGHVPAILVVGAEPACTGSSGPEGWSIEPVARPLRRLLVAARRVAVPVLFLCRSDLGGSREIDSRAGKEPEDRTVECAAADPFESEAFAALLEELGVDTLLLAGGSVSANLRATALAANRCGLGVMVPYECVGDQSVEALRESLLELQRGETEVVELGEALAFLERAHIESMIAAWQ